MGYAVYWYGRYDVTCFSFEASAKLTAYDAGVKDGLGELAPALAFTDKDLVRAIQDMEVGLLVKQADRSHTVPDWTIPDWTNEDNPGAHAAETESLSGNKKEARPWITTEQALDSLSDDYKDQFGEVCASVESIGRTTCCPQDLVGKLQRVGKSCRECVLFCCVHVLCFRVNGRKHSLTHPVSLLPLAQTQRQ